MPLLHLLGCYIAISLMGVSTLEINKKVAMEDRICKGSTGMYASWRQAALPSSTPNAAKDVTQKVFA